jgi:hypothetical protein
MDLIILQLPGMAEDFASVDRQELHLLIKSVDFSFRVKYQVIVHLVVTILREYCCANGGKTGKCGWMLEAKASTTLRLVRIQHLSVLINTEAVYQKKRNNWSC